MSSNSFHSLVIEFLGQLHGFFGITVRSDFDYYNLGLLGIVVTYLNFDVVFVVVKFSLFLNYHCRIFNPSDIASCITELYDTVFFDVAILRI